MKMNFDYDGTTYGLDLDDELSVAEARAIKQHAGMSVQEWMDGIQVADVDALCGMVFLAVRRGGRDIEWSDLDNMNLIKLASSVMERNDIPDTAAGEGAGSLPAALNRAQRRAQPKKATSKAAAE